MSHDYCSSLRPSCRSAHQSLVASLCSPVPSEPASPLLSRVPSPSLAECWCCPAWVPSPGKASGHVTSSVGIFSCRETSQDGSVDPGPRSSLRGRATRGFSHCPPFMLYTLTLQASSEKQGHCRTFMSCIPVSVNETRKKKSHFFSCGKVLFHIFLALL